MGELVIGIGRTLLRLAGEGERAVERVDVLAEEELRRGVDCEARDEVLGWRRGVSGLAAGEGGAGVPASRPRSRLSCGSS